MVVDIGAYRGTGSPIKLSRTPATYRLAPPRFGEHTAAILDEAGVQGELFADALPGFAPADEAQASEAGAATTDREKVHG